MPSLQNGCWIGSAKGAIDAVQAFDSLAQEEWVTLERNLHTLKSMAASIGGQRLALNYSSDLESRAHNRTCVGKILSMAKLKLTS